MLKERVRKAEFHSDEGDDDEYDESSDSDDDEVEMEDFPDDQPSDEEEVGSMEDPETWSELTQYIALGVASVSNEDEAGTIISFPNWIQVSVPASIYPATAEE